MTDSNPEDQALLQALAAYKASRTQVSAAIQKKLVVFALATGFLSMLSGFAVVYLQKRFPVFSAHTPLMILALMAVLVLPTLVFLFTQKDKLVDPRRNDLIKRVLRRQAEIQDLEQRRAFAASVAEACGSQIAIMTPRQRFLSLAGGLVCAGLFFYVTMFAHIFHTFETIGILATATLPLSAMMMFFSLKASPIGPAASPAGTAAGYLASFLMCCAFWTLILLAANALFDFSTPKARRYLIVQKHMFNDSDHRDRYIVTVDGGQASRLPPGLFPWSGGTDWEEIDIGWSAYQAVTPHVTTITLQVHPGLLGFPWYERRWTFENSGPAEAVPADPAAIQACAWTKNFNVGRSIETIPPDNYRRDFWPGGQPRSVEPLVHGQVHGIAHYTYANGLVYGDIPWNHGQKHGVFTLYRADGTADQTLSYKNGVPYGLNVWYGSDGNVRERWLMLEQGRNLPGAVCDSPITQKGK